MLTIRTKIVDYYDRMLSVDDLLELIVEAKVFKDSNRPDITLYRNSSKYMICGFADIPSSILSVSVLPELDEDLLPIIHDNIQIIYDYLNTNKVILT